VKTERLTESKTSTVTLTDSQADELRRIGRALASQKQWWGASDDADTPNRSVVRCERLADTRHTVRVADAIGAIGLGDLQLIIEPKIPLPHLLYLLVESNQVPRSLYERSSLGVDDNFFSLIARWFVHTCEVLLRHGLVSDYGRVTADLPCARGRIHTVKTAQSVLAGRPVIRCEFDRFGEDTSLNRVLKAAGVRLLGLRGLPLGLRERCRRIHHRLSDVGELRRADLGVRPDALSRRYRDAHPLALAILASTGLSMEEGGKSTWTFLFRTPEAVEEGLRNSLRTHLEPAWKVQKTAKILVGDRKRSLNPDLVFGRNEAIGDVKYRLTVDGEIKRGELNQVTTFATGYHAKKATVIAFGTCEAGEEVHVGPVQVNGFNWNSDEATPEQAARRLAERVESWLTRVCDRDVLDVE
jgi:5-methylcytosine-specific restriction endonuclease McrBC regulatory subunit McrC